MCGPVHDVVGRNERRNNVEDLSLETAPGVEDGGMACAGERPLSVRGDVVGDDSLLLLLRSAWFGVLVSMFRFNSSGVAGTKQNICRCAVDPPLDAVSSCRQ